MRNTKATYSDPVKSEIHSIPIEWLEQEIEHAKEFGEDTSFVEYCIDLWKGKIDGDEPSESSTTIFRQLAAAEAKIKKLEAEIKRLKEQDDIRRSWENYEERMGS